MSSDEYLLSIARAMGVAPDMLRPSFYRIWDEIGQYGSIRAEEIGEIAVIMSAYHPAMAWEYLLAAPSFLSHPDRETPVKVGALACSVMGQAPDVALLIIRKGLKLLSLADFPTLRLVTALSETVYPYSAIYARRVFEESSSIVTSFLDAGVNLDQVNDAYRLALATVSDDWGRAVRLPQDILVACRALGGKDLGGAIEALLAESKEFANFGAGVLAAYIEVAAAVLGCRDVTPGDRTLMWEAVYTIARSAPESAAKLLSSLPHYLSSLVPANCLEKVREIFPIGTRLALMNGTLAEAFITAMIESCREGKGFSYREMEFLSRLCTRLAHVGYTVAQAFLRVASIVWSAVGEEGLQEVTEQIEEVGKLSPDVAVRLAGVSSDVIAEGGIRAWRSVSALVAWMAKDDRSSAIRFLERCCVWVKEVLATGSLDTLALLCEHGRGLVTDMNARVALSFMERGPAYIQEVGISGILDVEDMIRTLERESSSVAIGLLTSGLEVIKRVGMEGLRSLVELVRQVARNDSYSAASLWERAPEMFDRLRDLDREGISQIIRVAGVVARENGRLAISFLEAAGRVKMVAGMASFSTVLTLAEKIATGGNAAKRLMELSPDIVERMGPDILLVLGELVTVLSHSLPQEALSVIDGCPALMDRLEMLEGNVAPSAVYRRVTQAAAVSPSLAVALIDKSLELVENLGLNGFDLVVSHLINVAAKDEEAAMRMISADHGALGVFATGIPEGVAVKEIKPLLATYLKALLGRRVEITEGEKSDTDGVRIFLPRRIREFQDWEDNFRVYKVLATIEEARLEFGGHIFSPEALEDVIDMVTSKYGRTWSDAGDEDEWTKFYRLFPEPLLMADLVGIMEGYRIEHILAREYPGLIADIVRYNVHRFKKRRPPAKILNRKRRVVEVISRQLALGMGQEDISFPGLRSLTERACRYVSVLDEHTGDIHDAIRVAFQVYRDVTAEIDEPYRVNRPLVTAGNDKRGPVNVGSFTRTARELERHLQGNISGEGDGGIRIEREGNSSGEQSPSSRVPSGTSRRRRLGEKGHDGAVHPGGMPGGRGESGKSSASKDAFPQVQSAYSSEKIERLLKEAYRDHGITPAEVERRIAMMWPYEAFLFLRGLEHTVENGTELPPEPGTFLYPEWGKEIGDYRRNWVRVRERALAAGTLEFYRETGERYRGLVKRIKREFQLLRPESMKRKKRQRFGEEIDIDAAVEYLIDRRLKITPREENYILYQKTRRDIAVALLVDMSRSTKGDVITREKEALIVLSEAIDEVGDAFAIFGFSGDNRNNVEFYLIKGFEERYDNRVKGRISAMADHYENRDGAAIRHAASLLKRRRERAKVLILISDGKPVDKDYAGDYAVEDTRMALKETFRDGIRTFCITVDWEAADYLPRMYSPSRWIVIDDVARLPERITGIYRMLTT